MRISSSPTNPIPETRPLPAFIRWVRVITAVVFGIGYIFGSGYFASSPAFYYVKQLPLPLPAWGLLFILCALVTLRTKVLGYFLTSLVWFTWSLLIFEAMINGYIALWGAWVWPMHMAFVNMYELTVWGRSKAVLMRQHGASNWGGLFRTIRKKSGG